MADPRPLRLGVNIDHVATIRNARGGDHPDPVKAALTAAAAGADGITAHLREDRRHIRDDDIRSEEHTSELQSLMRISYAVLCVKTKITQEILMNSNRRKQHETRSTPK